MLVGVAAAKAIVGQARPFPEVSAARWLRLGETVLSMDGIGCRRPDADGLHGF